MTYREWRAVYIDKSKTFDAWQKEMEAKYRADSLTSTTTRGNVDKSKTGSTGEENILRRPTTNKGAFAHLKVPMQLRAIKQICRNYGVDISKLKIKIQREEDLLNYFYAGSAAPEYIGRVDLFPHAFANEDELLRTIIHEGCHVKQFIKYGSVYVQEHRKEMEEVAERYERFFLNIVKRRVHHGS